MDKAVMSETAAYFCTKSNVMNTTQLISLMWKLSKINN